jgi:hypothetical protein
LGEARGGTELGPKSKTDPPGLGFGQRNVEAFIFKQRGPHQGGVHRVLGRGGQQLGVAPGGGLVPKSQKLSRQGSILADEIWGPLFWVEGIWVGPGKHGCERGWGWFFSWYAKWGLV